MSNIGDITGICYWNNWYGGKSKLQRLNYLVKATHDNQLWIKAQVSCLKKDKQRNRIGLDAVISSIKLLVRQGMSLHGNG